MPCMAIFWILICQFGEWVLLNCFQPILSQGIATGVKYSLCSADFNQKLLAFHNDQNFQRCISHTIFTPYLWNLAWSCPRVSWNGKYFQNDYIISHFGSIASSINQSYPYPQNSYFRQIFPNGNIKNINMVNNPLRYFVG